MIYLDSAATTFQKPRSVANAMDRALATMSSPGRGGYPAAMAAADAALDCRTELAELYHAESPEQVVFTLNATHALNIAIKSLVPLFQRAAVTEAFDRLIVPGTDAVICNHVSNVFGFVQPVEEIAALCRDRGVPFIIDASQSAGLLTLDMAALGAAFIAMPGHKGLYGPQGTGVLICGRDAPVRTVLEGGTGSQSLEQAMPDFLPDRLEAGTHNMPGIAGLLAGVRFVRKVGPEAICQEERRLTLLAAEGLRRVPGIRVYARPDLEAQVGVLSLVPEKMDPETLGAALADRGIAVRAGLHCAPLAHRSAGTLETGTVRVSLSHWNTREEIGRFLGAMGAIFR